MKLGDNMSYWPESYRIAAEELFSSLHGCNYLNERIEKLQEFLTKYTAVPYVWICAANICFQHRVTPEKEIEYKKELFSFATFHVIDERWEEFLSTSNKKVFGKLVDSSNPNFELKCDTVIDILNSRSKCEKMIQYPNGNAKRCFDFYCKYSTKPVSEELKNKFEKCQQIYENIKNYKKLEYDNFVACLNRLELFRDPYDGILYIQNHGHQYPWHKEAWKIFSEHLERNEVVESMLYDDDVKWLELFKESGDINFIVQNIEQQLGDFPWYKGKWKIYLKFLEQNNLTELMLLTYSRYCEIFIGDLEMRKKYQKSMENSSTENLKNWQLDLIKIERNFGSLKRTSFKAAAKLLEKYFFNNTKIRTKDEFEKYLKVADESVVKLTVSPLTKYIEEDYNISIARESKKHLFKFSMDQKNLAFSPTFLYSILKKANYNILEKLYSSSKYFYAVFKAPLCYKIIIGKDNTLAENPNHTVSFQNTLFISNDELDPIPNIHKIYLKEALIVKKACPSFLKIVSKIYKCEIRFLKIVEQEMKFQEFKFLATKVEDLKLLNASILDTNDQAVPVPEIIEVIEKIEKAAFDFGPNAVTMQSGFPAKNKTVSMKFKNTLKHFTFSSTGKFNDPTVMRNFIEKNAAPQASFLFSFDHDVNERGTFLMAFREMRNTWFPAPDKPKIYLSFQNPLEQYKF